MLFRSDTAEAPFNVCFETFQLIYFDDVDILSSVLAAKFVGMFWQSPMSSYGMYSDATTGAAIASCSTSAMITTLPSPGEKVFGMLSYEC